MLHGRGLHGAARRLGLAGRCARGLGLLLVGLAAWGAHVDAERGPTFGAEAHATTSVMMTLDELVQASSVAVVAQPVERYSKWEVLGDSRRIVTYTRLVLEESMLSGPGTADVWVRTLGGTVDKIGQHVAGEAQFTIGETALVFLAKPADTLVVVGMAQGHFPLVEAAEDRILVSSPDTGTLLRKKKDVKAARDELVGATLSEARKKILKAKKAAKK